MGFNLTLILNQISKKRNVFFFLFLLFTFLFHRKIYAQHNYGVTTSNYAFTESVLNNPSRASNRMVKWEIGFLNFSLFTNSNYFIKKSIFESLNDEKNFSAYNLLTLTNGFNRNRTTDLNTPVQLYNHTEMRYLSGLYTFGKKLKKGVALSFSTKSDFNLENINPGFFLIYDKINLLSEDVDQTELVNFSYPFNNSYFLHHLYNEIRVDFGTEIINDDSKRISLGIALKRNIGLYYNLMKIDDGVFTLRETSVGIVDLHTTGDFRYSYAGNRFPNNLSFPFANNFGIQNQYGGWATDLGFEYEIKITKKKKEEKAKKDDGAKEDSSHVAKEDSSYLTKEIDLVDFFKKLYDSNSNDCNKNYMIKFSFSVNNIGYVNYPNNINNNNSFSFRNTNPDISIFTNWMEAINEISSPDLFYSYLVNQSPTSDQTTTTETIFLPATATGSIDLKIPSQKWPFNKSYINIGYTQDLLFFNNILANRAISHGFFVPRYESKNLDISFPLIIYTGISPQLPLLKFGVGLRYKYFYIGTESFGSIFSKPSTQVLSFYFGGKFSMFKECVTCNKDIDSIDLFRILNSRLSDKAEEDLDNDRVLDKKDKCLNVAGDVLNDGCPIVVKEAFIKSKKASQEVNFILADERPIVLEGFDIYIDSFLHYLQNNPKIDILVSAFGDDTIKSPEQKFKLAKKRAENTAEQLINKGLQPFRIKNIIGMGYLQPQGTVQILRIYENGKDTDYDGILDSSDHCPTLLGLKKYEGCPLYKTEEEILLEEISQGIDFINRSPKTTIDSEKSLDRLQNFLTNHPQAQLLIYGSSDSSMYSIKENEEISKLRAEEIHTFLLSKGIPSSRIHTLGISHIQPPTTYLTLNVFNRRKDSDDDGVYNYEDKCPTIYGTFNEEGCPAYYKEKIFIEITELSKKIQFNPGTSDFTVSSLEYLYQLKNKMEENQNISIIINENATEEDLNPKQKDKLAQDRSNKIYYFLLKECIDTNRMISNGLSYLEKDGSVEKVRILDTPSDFDNDGIYDYEDKCPTILGSLRDYGCPKSYYQEDIIEKFSKNFYFLPSSEKVPPPSMDLLEELSDHLKINPQEKIVIYGSLNNPTASPNERRDMAQKRSAVIDNYLRSKGISTNQYYSVDFDPIQDVNAVPQAKRITSDEDPDKDGVGEKYDKCPTMHGSLSHYGCPIGPKTGGTDLSSKDIGLKEIEKNFLNDISNNLTFSPGSSMLTMEGQEAMLKLIENFNKNPNRKFIIYAKHDNNQALPIEKERLAQKRAKRLSEILTQSGISQDRFNTIPIGAQQPISDINSVKVPRKSNDDTDKDDILDTMDRCPTIPGNIENYGCPTSAITQEQFQLAALNIYFRVNSNQLNPSSYKSLNNLAYFLLSDIKINFKENTYLFIYGNTDNTGAEEYNDYLSRQRAKTIMNYLIARGVNKEKVVAIGFGETMPIETNETAEGRRINRRVEFQISNF